MGLQALLALLQLLRQGRLNYAQLGIDSLLLTTNNTGELRDQAMQGQQQRSSRGLQDL
jgi:hypothetical protein